MELPTPLVLLLVLLAALVGLHSLLLIGVIRMLAQVYEAVFPGQGPPADYAGKEAPSFAANTIAGVGVDSSSFRGRLTALLFVSPLCESCAATLEELEAVRLRAAGNVYVVCSGDLVECKALGEKLRPVEIIHDRHGDLRTLFEIRRTPTAVLIGKSGRIQSVGEPHRGELQAVLDEA
jgi:AhpC/TSA family